MIKTPLMATTLAALCMAQVAVPDGTRLRVQLANNLSSATSSEGQTVELTLSDEVKIGNQVVFPEGTRVTGTVTEAIPKRRMGRSGKLDFSIDRARAIDGQWVPLRYEVHKKAGQSHAVRTGVITAGVAILFWPAAPFMLLAHGKDITINRGVGFDVYTDRNHQIAAISAAPATQVASQQAPAPAPAVAPATISIASNSVGAEIQIDDAFVGNTPSAIQLAPGTYRVVVRAGTKTWNRSITIAGGSSISLFAEFGERATQTAARNQ